MAPNPEPQHLNLGAGAGPVSKLALSARTARPPWHHFKLLGFCPVLGRVEAGEFRTVRASGTTNPDENLRGDWRMSSLRVVTTHMLNL